MKRLTILIATVALFASMATIAFADDATEGESETETERELNEAQMWKVNLLADYWMSGEEIDESSESGVTEGEGAEEEVSIEDEIEALRTGETVVGWGAMFKLMQLARAYETSLTEVVSMVKDADEGWAFGRRFKELDEDQENLARPEGHAKNLGQLKKQYREENGTHAKKPKKP